MLTYKIEYQESSKKYRIMYNDGNDGCSIAGFGDIWTELEDEDTWLSWFFDMPLRFDTLEEAKEKIETLKLLDILNQQKQELDKWKEVYIQHVVPPRPE